MKSHISIILMLCILLSCSPKQPDVAALKSQIESVNQQFMDAAAKKDADAISKLYTEDARFMPPNSPAVTGREAVKNQYSGMLGSGISGVKLIADEVNGTGDLAIESGKYQVLVGENIADEGKYLVEWKKVGGKWLLNKDIFSSDRPAPRSAAQKDQTVSVVIYKVKKGNAEKFENFVKNTLMPATDRSTPDKDFAMQSVRLLSAGDEKTDGTFIFIFDPYVGTAEYDIEKILVAKHGDQKGKQLYKEFDALVAGYEFYPMKQTDI